MKKLITLLLCAILCLTVLVACDKGDAQPTDTKGENNTVTTAPAEDAPEAPTAAPETEAPSDETNAPSDETNAPSDETQDPADQEYDPELYVVIRTPEDLMAFNKAVNEEFDYFDDKTVVFLADLDMTGYEWVPLDGEYLFNVTFEGNGHTISNLQFAEYAPEPRPNDPTYASTIGSGFVGVATQDMTFRNLTIDTASVIAYERAVGCFVGVQTDGFISFENCTVKNFTAEGWMDSGNQNREEGGHPISFRLAGFVGHNMAGQLYFLNCHAENLKLSGFHNLAAFVGYGSATLDEYAFENCSVKNMECTFSYCLSDSYSIDMPRKFVSVFFNHCQWIDKVEACVDMGNTFEGVSYYDWTDNNTEYTPSDFKSWSDEEANAGA